MLSTGAPEVWTTAHQETLRDLDESCITALRLLGAGGRLDGLSRFSRLTKLDASNNDLSVAQIEDLQSIQSLRHLSFRALDDSRCKAVSCLIQLESLTLSTWGPAMSTIGLEHLATLRGITKLRLEQLGSLACSDHFAGLSGFEVLRHIEFDRCEGLDASVLEYLPSRVALQSLSVSYCPRMNDLGRHFPKAAALTRLVLEDAVLDGSAFDALSRCRALSFLSLYSSEWDTERVRINALQAARSWPLDVALLDNTPVSDDMVRELLQAGRLSVLSLRGNATLTDAALPTLVPHQGLKEADFTGCSLSNASVRF